MHQWQVSLTQDDQNSDALVKSLMAIKSGTTITASACEEFRPPVTVTQCIEHHPQTIQAVYHAAKTALQMGHSLFEARSVEATISMLTMQSTRWKLASKFNTCIGLENH